MKTAFFNSSILLCGFLVACGDTDKDGLSDAEESELGTDPESEDSDGDGLSDFKEANDLGTDPVNADTDGDGLNDGDEVQNNTDPKERDSDGDGYWDSWEITEGTNPNDAEDKIYIGGWPYQPNKEEGAAPADAQLTVGASLARVKLLDQFGQEVDLYDFSKQGKLTVIDVSAIWCPPCQGIASWLSGQGDSYGWGNEYPNVAEKIHSGEVQWITVLGEDNQGNVPDVTDLARWYEDYPDPNIPVLADTSDSLFKYNYLDGGWPTIFVLDGNMDIGVVPGSGNNFYKALAYINDL